RTLLASTTDIQSVQLAHTQMLQELLQRVSLETGVPVAPLQRVLDRLGMTNVRTGEIANQLALFADRYLDLQHRLLASPDSASGADRARHEANALLDQGDLDGAQAVLS